MQATLVKGGSGVYDVVLDGTRVLSKHEAGRLPETVDLLEMLRS